MKKMKALLAAAGIMSVLFASTAFGAGWVQSGTDGPGEVRWWYDLDGGQYYAGNAQGPLWQWIDGNGDGTAECYAFDENGWMYADTTTPDGYQVNGDGAWTENGQVQTRETEPGYGGTGTAVLPQAETNRDEDVLIAYFSRTGNTRQIAELIQDQIGGDIFEIQPAESYPSSYSATTERAEREIASGTLPALASDVENFDEYEIVFVGYPIWWDTTPPVVNTFLNSHEFNGKTVVPFCTSGGSGINGSLTNNAIQNGVHLQLRQKKKCSPDFVLPSYMEFYTEQGEKATDPLEKQAEIVAFTYAMVHLQLHKISNVHLQFQCCI